MNGPAALLAAGAAVLFAAAVPVRAADLVVEIVDLRSDSGQVRVALFDTPATFPTDHGKIGELILEPQGRAARGTFANLAPGTYALASYHDENGNHSFDKNILGWPLEGFAFSSDATVSFFSPPSFARAAIIVPEGGAAAAVRMIYW